MRRLQLSEREKGALLAALVLLAVLLATLLGLLIYEAAEEERRLREEQAEASREADRLAALTTEAPPPPEYRGLTLLRMGNEELKIFYLGGRSAYGTEEGRPTIGGHSWRTVLRDRFSEELGYRLAGFVSERYMPTPTFAEGELEFREAYLSSHGTCRLAIVAPEREMIGTARASFGEGLETLLLAMREAAPYTDILLAVPPDADAEEAETILALAAHYGLVAVDTRTPLAGMLGGDGLPTAEGHTAMAELILDALLAAAEEPPTQLTPSDRLYQ